MHIPDHRSPAAAVGLPSPPVTERETPLFDGVLQRLTQLLVGVDAYRKARRTAADLAMLDDHLLADIGLSRSDLPRGQRSRQHTDPWQVMADWCPR